MEEQHGSSQTNPVPLPSSFWSEFDLSLLEYQPVFNGEPTREEDSLNKNVR